MNELKPEDVMRALECCADKRCYGTRDSCPLFDWNEEDDAWVCTNKLCKAALALLRENDAEIKGLVEGWSKDQDRFEKVCAEKDAEIERLNAEMKILRCEDCWNLAQTEAITEFHRKYHEHLDFMNNINKPSPSWNTDDIQRVIVACGAIADQVKNEMKGATDGKSDL
jgi:hypothetical protein